MALLLFSLSPWQVMAVESPPISPPEVLLSPAFLASLSGKADQKIEEIVKMWPIFSGAQGFEEKLVKRQEEFKILGVRFEAEYRVYKESEAADINFHANEYPENFCPNFYEWIQTKLGQSSLFVDRSTSSPSGSTIDISAEWIFNAIKVQMLCGGITVGKEHIPVMTFLTYRHKDHLDSLKDLIYIKCVGSKRTYKINGRISEKVLSDPPQMWIIDPERKVLLSANKNRFGKTELYSDDVIIASKQTGDIALELKINRFTGNYLSKAKTEKDFDGTFEEWGTCLKIDPRQKF